MKKEISTQKVPFLQKMAFGSGHLVNNLLPGALGVFSFFLMTAFGIEPKIAGLLTAIPRFFDAISDPIMGFITDNTQSRFGRRRPYIFVGAILCSILFVVQWQLFEENGSTYNFWYFLFFSIIFILANTVFSTPLIALGYEMTTDVKERTRLMGFANTIGQISWMIVPLFWIIIANKDLFASQAEGVRTLSIYVGAACLLFGLMPVFFCKEIDNSSADNKAKITISNIVSNLKLLWRDMVNISKNIPFMRLCGATFLVFNGFQMVASFSYFIIVYHMYNGSYEASGTVPAFFSIIGAVVTAVLVIPIVTKMANAWGKKNAFIISTVISIFGYLLKWFGFVEVDENTFILFKDAYVQFGVVKFSLEIPAILLLPIPFMAFGLGGLFTLMMSMTADVCDLDELRNGLPRREGTFGAIYWLMIKIGQSIALAVGGLVLSLVGFDAGLAHQSKSTLTQLRIADVAIPSITAALAIVVMWKYNFKIQKNKKIGILGGGQLGKMFIEKTQRYEDTFFTLDPDPDCPCAPISQLTVGDYNKYEDVLQFCQGKDIVTIEIEHVNTEALLEAERQGITVIPSPSTISLFQQKIKQKEFYQQHQIPTAAFQIIQSANDSTHIPYPFVQKSNVGGYDGKGVQIIRNEDERSKLWNVPSVLEEVVDIDVELAIIVAKNTTEIKTFPVTEMVADSHYNLLDFTISPAKISMEVQQQIDVIVEKFVSKITSSGLYAIEMFLDTKGKVWVNETAPRLHNSGHVTQNGNVNCQFEQLYRTICDYPLANTNTTSQAGMLNLIGAENYTGEAVFIGLDEVEKMPNAFVHLYGKKITKPGRKMGHINIVNEDRQELIKQLNEVKSIVKVISK